MRRIDTVNIDGKKYSVNALMGQLGVSRARVLTKYTEYKKGKITAERFFEKAERVFRLGKVKITASEYMAATGRSHTHAVRLLKDWEAGTRSYENIMKPKKEYACYR